MYFKIRSYYCYFSWLFKLIFVCGKTPVCTCICHKTHNASVTPKFYIFLCFVVRSPARGRTSSRYVTTWRSSRTPTPSTSAASSCRPFTRCRCVLVAVTSSMRAVACVTAAGALGADFFKIRDLLQLVFIWRLFSAKHSFTFRAEAPRQCFAKSLWEIALFDLSVPQGRPMLVCERIYFCGNITASFKIAKSQQWQNAFCTSTDYCRAVIGNFTVAHYDTGLCCRAVLATV